MNSSDMEKRPSWEFWNANLRNEAPERNPGGTLQHNSIPIQNGINFQKKV